MTERLMLTLVNTFALLIILAMQIIAPKTTRKNILFGVKVPEDAMDDEDIIKIQKSFKRNNLLIGIPILILLSILFYIYPNPISQVILIVGYVGIIFSIYLKTNFKVKELKKNRGWNKSGEKIVVVDMKFSRDKMRKGSISYKWFLIPLGIIILNFALGIILYPVLPEKIPTHWNFQGEITTYRDKSYGVILMLPVMQLFMWCFLYVSCWMIGRSKQQINPNNPEESLRKNIIFRKAWSIYLLILTILMVLLFTILNLLSYGVFFKTIKWVNIFTFIILGFSIIGSIGLGIKIGQGGERLRFKEDKKTGKIHDRDDDDLWKLGNIYYNPDDSSLFVEKRFGVGWTVNVGRPLGMFLTILPFIIGIITLIIVAKL